MNALFPERSKQLQQLYSLGVRHEHAYLKRRSSFPVFVVGSASTGKSFCIPRYFSTLNDPDSNWDSAAKVPLHEPIAFVYVNAEEALGQKSQLFSLISEQLHGIETSGKADNTVTFLEKIVSWCDNSFFFGTVDEENVDAERIPHFTAASGSRRLLIIDSAEKLLEIDDYLVPYFFQLGKLSEKNFQVVLISNCSFEAYLTHLSVEPLVVFFPSYTLKELTRILKRDFETRFEYYVPEKLRKECDMKEVASLFANLVEISFTTLSDATMNTRDILSVIRTLWPVYIRPLVDGHCKVDNTKRLQVLIDDYIRHHLDEIVFREVRPAKKRADHDNLTAVSKILLIASYIASYTDSTYDARCFGKANTRSKKLGHTKKKATNRELGPKSFVADRALAIFYRLIDEPIDASIDVYTQFVSLISKGYLSRIGSATNDKNFHSGLKCKCIADYGSVKRMGHSMKINIDNFIQ